MNIRPIVAVSAIGVSLLVGLILTGARQDHVQTARAAMARAAETQADQDIIASLDAAWRADDWSAASELARRYAGRAPSSESLRARVARALWRGGELRAAEAEAAGLSPRSGDPTALAIQCRILLANGRRAESLEIADRLWNLRPKLAEELEPIITARMANQKWSGLETIVAAYEEALDPARGYPDSTAHDVVMGLRDFLRSAGDAPMNRTTRHGEVSMSALMGSLPMAEAMINGEGPFRLILDTGGSDAVTLDLHVAQQLGLPSMGEMQLQGVSGSQPGTRTLLTSLELGAIRSERVLAVSIELPAILSATIDGVIGTGIYGDSRITFDWRGARFGVAASSELDAPGAAIPMRNVLDAKVLMLGEIEGRSVPLLLDTGADANIVSIAFMREVFPDAEFTTVDLPDTNLSLGVGHGGEPPRIEFGPSLELRFGEQHPGPLAGLGVDIVDDLLSPALGVEVRALVGIPLARRMTTTTIDFPQNRLWIEWLP